MSVDTSKHPCFNDTARHKFGRVHLPVAPKCNIQCNFCNRKYDCLNESRPGVTSSVLSPEQAIAYLHEVMARDDRISVVGIAGPGDPFANPEETMQTMRLVRKHYPEMILCLASNGLEILPYIDELATLQVSHVTITVSAVDPKVGSQIYAWVRDGRRILRGTGAAAKLLERQLDAIHALHKAGITVKVNTIVIPGINDGEHVKNVSRAVKAHGADIMNLMALYPAPGSEFEDLEQPSAEVMAAAKATAGEYLPLMHHCERCRADAVGLLKDSAEKQAPLLGILQKTAAGPLRPEESRPYVAVASMEGMLVNQHLGEAEQVWIFAPDGDGFKVVDTRPAPDSGTGNRRWEALAESLSDCRSLLCSGAGSAPRQALKAAGLKVVVLEALIEPVLTQIYSGVKVQEMPEAKHRCGSECAGNGRGCA